MSALRACGRGALAPRPQAIPGPRHSRESGNLLDAPAYVKSGNLPYVAPPDTPFPHRREWRSGGREAIGGAIARYVHLPNAQPPPVPAGVR